MLTDWMFCFLTCPSKTKKKAAIVWYWGLGFPVRAGWGSGVEQMDRQEVGIPGLEPSLGHCMTLNKSLILSKVLLSFSAVKSR